MGGGGKDGEAAWGHEAGETLPLDASGWMRSGRAVAACTSTIAQRSRSPLGRLMDLGQVRSPSHCVSVYVKAPIRFPLFSLM